VQSAEGRIAQLVHALNDAGSTKNTFCLFYDAIVDLYPKMKDVRCASSCAVCAKLVLSASEGMSIARAKGGA
jgi:hypothetical protein